ncbi:MAG: sortase [Candidatus Saccharibacteria bacterium]
MKLARVNTGLVVFIVLINAYVVVMPFLPALFFHVQKHSKHAVQLAQTVKDAPKPNSIPADAHSLIVPSMVLQADINEGPTIRTLRQGLWRIPTTSTPERGGNTVIAAHRFTYTNPRGMFYHLDQVHIGDPISILWKGKKYNYTVSQTKEVAPTALDIQAPTSTPELTLFTCTPLWNPKDRLVVVAQLESIQ